MVAGQAERSCDRRAAIAGLDGVILSACCCSGVGVRIDGRCNGDECIISHWKYDADGRTRSRKRDAQLGIPGFEVGGVHPYEHRDGVNCVAILYDVIVTTCYCASPTRDVSRRCYASRCESDQISCRRIIGRWNGVAHYGGARVIGSDTVTDANGGKGATQ